MLTAKLGSCCARFTERMTAVGLLPAHCCCCCWARDRLAAASGGTSQTLLPSARAHTQPLLPSCCSSCSCRPTATSLKKASSDSPPPAGWAVKSSFCCSIVASPLACACFSWHAYARCGEQDVCRCGCACCSCRAMSRCGCWRCRRRAAANVQPNDNESVCDRPGAGVKAHRPCWARSSACAVGTPGVLGPARNKEGVVCSKGWWVVLIAMIEVSTGGDGCVSRAQGMEGDDERSRRPAGLDGC